MVRHGVRDSALTSGHLADAVGMPDRDLPKVPDHREASYTTLESAVLREMIERTRNTVLRQVGDGAVLGLARGTHHR
jgi:hypothetical protein